MTHAGSAHDPLWFKDAVIHQLHVRAFFDSNRDGIGDVRGLIDKLDCVLCSLTQAFRVGAESPITMPAV